jgi:radical SAM protein with 4Fe4S-binding SPASM domain
MDITGPGTVKPLYPSIQDVVDFFGGSLCAPVTVDWEITMRCNLRCIHCCFTAGAPRNNELTEDEAKRVIDEMAHIGVFRVGFTGGEPLTRPDFLSIAAYARESGLELALNTNGTLINKEKARKIANLFIEAQVSLDGARPETHDLIRAQCGTFEAAIRGIRELKEAGATVVINTTLMEQNRLEVMDILSLALELEVDGYRVIPVRELGRAIENKLGLSIADLVEIYKSLDAIRPTLNGKINLQLSTVPTLLGRFLEEGYSCPAAIAKCCIDPEGNVKPCDAFDFFYGGNIRERSLEDIWLNSPEFQSFRRSIVEIAPPECRVCAFGRRCRGGCKGLAFLHYGVLNRADPQCVAIKRQRRKALGIS